MVLCKFFLQGNCKFGSSCKFEHDQGRGGAGQWSFGASQAFSSPLASSGPTQTPRPAPPQQGAPVDTATLVNAVVTDMKATEKGGQWLASTYAPFKEKPEFPGFEDYSFEEIRQMYYEAAKAGPPAVEQFKQQWQTILQNAIIKIKALQNPTPEVISMLVHIYNSAKSNTWTSPNQPFGGTTANSTGFFSSTTSTSSNIFSQNQPTQNTSSPFSTPTSTTQTGIFSQSQPNQKPAFGNTSLFVGAQDQAAQQQGVFSSVSSQQGSIFGQTAPVQTQSGSIFGTPQNQTPQTGIFGQALNTAGQQSSIFAKPTQNPPSTGNLFAPQGNIFSNQQATAQPGMPTATTSSSIFNQPASGIFNTQSSGNIFQTNPSSNVNSMAQPTQNQNAPQSMGSIFAQSQNAGQSAGILGAENQNSNQASNIFQANPSSNTNSSIFGVPNQSTAQSGSVFAVSNQGSSQSGSIFGQVAPSQPAGQNIFGNPQSTQQVDLEILKTAYSKLEDLTEAEIKWFQSDDIDIENIPIKPPTYEMCA